MVSILWSGLTGRTGQEAIKQQTEVAGVEIVAGLTRHVVQHEGAHRDTEDAKFMMSYNARLHENYGLAWCVKAAHVDVVVDFSHPDVFEEVLNLAIHTKKPLISGTSGLSNRQMALLYDATNYIPIFRGGNFRFKVKTFIDEAVELAKNTDDELTLYENFYEGKSLPSETSRVIQKRISEATSKTIEVDSKATLSKEQLVCDWRIGSLHCQTFGFNELAHDVLEIAKVMAKKPVKIGAFYDLDGIWDELTSQ